MTPLSLPIYHLPILVVDDNELNLATITESLKKHQFQNLYTACNGREALQKIEEVKPEIVILDIMMPEMDGYACCEQIRSHPHYNDLPILIQTGLNEPEARVKAFQHGATDFITKPVYPDEVHARVKVHLQNRTYLKSLRQYKERIESELESARQLQEGILPQPSEMKALQERQLDVASYFKPSSEIGGDFWGMKALFPQQTALWMVDFSGHGVAAALNAFRLQAYLQEYSSVEARPGEYLSHLNEKLLRIMMRGQFATMFYGIVDASSNTLFYSCACAPHPIVLRRDQQSSLIDGSGLPLGISLNRFDTGSLSFMPGETLILYSDAIIETPDANGRLLTESELMDLAEPQVGASAETIMNRILQRFEEHTGGMVSDDITLCVCKRI